MSNEWRTWTEDQLEKIRFDVQQYFCAYYSEIRRVIEGHDPTLNVLPLWFEGGRHVQVQACTDGVMVVHRLFKGEDYYEFGLMPEMLVKDAVARMSPSRPGGEQDVALLEYEPVRGFGVQTWEEPDQPIYQMNEEIEAVEEVPWVRLDVADLNNLNVWEDNSNARQEARRILSQYIST